MLVERHGLGQPRLRQDVREAGDAREGERPHGSRAPDGQDHPRQLDLHAARERAGHRGPQPQLAWLRRPGARVQLRRVHQPAPEVGTAGGARTARPDDATRRLHPQANALCTDDGVRRCDAQLRAVPRPARRRRHGPQVPQLHDPVQDRAAARPRARQVEVGAVRHLPEGPRPRRHGHDLHLPQARPRRAVGSDQEDARDDHPRDGVLDRLRRLHGGDLRLAAGHCDRQGLGVDEPCRSTPCRPSGWGS